MPFIDGHGPAQGRKIPVLIEDTAERSFWLWLFPSEDSEAVIRWWRSLASKPYGLELLAYPAFIFKRERLGVLQRLERKTGAERFILHLASREESYLLVGGERYHFGA